jgi:hypothetical protein
MKGYFLLIVLIPLALAQEGDITKDQNAKITDLNRQIDVLTKGLVDSQGQVRYYKTQMKYFKAQADALIEILNEFQSCVKIGNVPEFSTDGDPVCNPRK